MQSRVAKLEAAMATVATREDLARLEVKLYREITEIHREISGIQRDVSGIHRDINRIHQAVNAQTWKILSTLICTSTLLVSVTYYFAKNGG
jgi:hypothetical protein